MQARTIRRAITFGVLVLPLTVYGCASNSTTTNDTMGTPADAAARPGSEAAPVGDAPAASDDAAPAAGDATVPPGRDASPVDDSAIDAGSSSRGDAAGFVGPSEQASMADALVDSIGVNSDLCGALSTTDKSNQANVITLIGQAGIRHIRDGFAYQPQTCTDAMNQAYTMYGIRNLVQAGAGTSGTSASLVNSLLVTYPHLEAIEGPNEPDVALGSGWVASATEQEQTIHSAVAANSAYAGIDNVCAALAYPDHASQVGYHAWASLCTRGSGHNYLDGLHPENEGDVTWTTPDGTFNEASTSATFESGSFTTALPSTDSWMTEVGWCSGTSNNGETGLPCAPDSVIVKYAPRLFLYNFAYVHGGRTYYFRSTDDAAYGAWATNGLIQSDGNTVKPQYTAIKSLIGLLADPGAGFTPGSLYYTLGGSTSGVNHALFQKRDGSFYLAIWIGALGWQPGAPGSPINVASQNVTLTFGEPIGAITAYAFGSDGNATSSSLAVASPVAVTATDSVTILKLVP